MGRRRRDIRQSIVDDFSTRREETREKHNPSLCVCVFLFFVIIVFCFLCKEKNSRRYIFLLSLSHTHTPFSHSKSCNRYRSANSGPCIPGNPHTAPSGSSSDPARDNRIPSSIAIENDPDRRIMHR